MSLEQLHPVSHVIATATEDGMVLADPLQGTVRVLNEVGALIWGWLSQGMTTTEMERLLAARYDIAPDKAAADLRSFLAQLHTAGLIGPPA